MAWRGVAQCGAVCARSSASTRGVTGSAAASRASRSATFEVSHHSCLTFLCASPVHCTKVLGYDELAMGGKREGRVAASARGMSS